MTEPKLSAETEHLLKQEDLKRLEELRRTSTPAGLEEALRAISAEVTLEAVRSRQSKP